MTIGSPTFSPLKQSDDCPAFDEAWQAEALAMADTLVSNDLISAKDWSATLGECLQQATEQGLPDSHATYYQCVLNALAKLLEHSALVSAQELDQTEQDWRAAYLATPHGQPVDLAAAKKL